MRKLNIPGLGILVRKFLGVGDIFIQTICGLFDKCNGLIVNVKLSNVSALKQWHPILSQNKIITMNL